MADIKKVQQNASEMIKANKERNRQNTAITDMMFNNWRLPGALGELDWMHTVISSDPSDAVNTATAIFSTAKPRLRITPPDDHAKTKENYNKMETAIQWHFDNASRRRRSDLLRDVILSAIAYDEVVVEINYLPFQQKGLPPSRARERYGPFSIIVHNPSDVYVTYSDWMPEAVLKVKNVPIGELEMFYGSKVQGLKKSGGVARDYEYATLYDYMNQQDRVIWAIPTDTKSTRAEPEGKDVLILNEKHNMEFLPWVAKVGGSSLFDDPKLARNPLLASVVRTGQWNTQNSIDSLMFSKVITSASAPSMWTDADPSQVDINYDNPLKIAHVPKGYDLKPFPASGLDADLLQLANMLGGRIGQSTVSDILRGGDIPSGTAFSTINAAAQSALKQLAPYKNLAEEALEDVFTKMFEWFNFNKDNIRIPGGEIPWDMIPIDQLYIEVTLSEDLPTDMQARVNTATQMVNELDYSTRRALEQIGENDPDTIMKESMEEALENTQLEIEQMEMVETAKQDILMRQNGADAAVIIANMEGGAEILAQIAQQMMMQQERQQQAAPPGEGNPPNPNNTPGTNLEGSGYDANQGGQPVIAADSQSTFEAQRQTDRRGMDIA